MFGKLSAARLLQIAAALVATGLGALLLTNLAALSELKVGGPLYQRIVQGKDLVADILPPPAYVIEAYLEATLAVRAPTSVAEHEQRLHQLKKDYDERLAYWRQQTLDAGVQELLTKKSDAYAMQFWALLEEKLLPAIKANDAGAMDAAYASLQDAYQKHRSAIDEVVAATNKVNDAVEAQSQSELTFYQTLVWGVSLGVLVLCLGSLWAISRGVIRPLGAMTGAMRTIASGEYTVEVPGTGRGDEIGSMAEAVAIFKANGIEAERLRQEQDKVRTAAEESRKAALRAMADMVEQEAGGVFANVSKGTEEMKRQAVAMTTSAHRVEQSAESVSGASSQALASANAIASATEQMTASIREIAARVADAARVTKETVEASGRTKATFERLSAVIGKIGEVANVISEIAGQTNLLALNATIEAARAGESGKGFAVVANEVKQLSSQTTKSTEDIRRQIEEILTVTQLAVSATQEIDTRISEVDSIAATVAAAIEQQSAATREIAQNVSQTASAMDNVAAAINLVSQEGKLAGEQSVLVQSGASAVAEAVASLREAITRIVRTSTPDVDRREKARATVNCRGRVQGRINAEVAVQSLSVDGATLVGADLRTGETARLEVDGATIDIQVAAARDGTARIRFPSGITGAFRRALEKIPGGSQLFAAAA